MAPLLAGPPAAAQHRLPSINNFGGAGLIEIPTAFMPEDGHVWFGASGGPRPGYRHAFAGFQALPWFEAALRHSDFATDGNGRFDLLAADVKFRLRPESAHWPQLAFGARGLFGDGVLAGEYLVASRHFRWGEATLGLGWGRFAGRGLLPNPFRMFGGHFRDDRPIRRSSGVAGFEHLFTGEEIGVFGGASLRTPWRNLRFQFEYSSDDFAAERRLSVDFDARVPVNVGLVWQPIDGVQLAAAFEQGDRAMLRLAFGGDPGRLPLQLPPGEPPSILARHDAPADDGPAAVADALANAGAGPTAVSLENRRIAVWIEAEPGWPASLGVGRSARTLTAAAPPFVTVFDITLGSGSFDLTSVSLIRGDLERAARHAGSAEEIWRNATLQPANAPPSDARIGLGLEADAWVELRGDLGLEAPEADTLVRWSLLTEAAVRHRSGLVFTGAARINLADNLVPPDFTERLIVPVRSDRVLFAEGPRVRLERSVVGHRWQPAPDLYAETTFGYLEEAYAGWRSEVLWRPFGRRFAAGVESVQAFRRDPTSQWQLFPIVAETAHLNLYWRPPGTELTTQISAGRYLAGDVGATARMWRSFDNGLRIDAWGTLSNAGEGDGVLAGGVELVVPLQRLVPILPRSRARLRLAPLLRDSGQRLDWPDDLYTLTDPASFEAVAGSWGQLLD